MKILPDGCVLHLVSATMKGKRAWRAQAKVVQEKKLAICHVLWYTNTHIIKFKRKEKIYLMENIQFKDIPISKETKRAIAEMGFEEATSIQTQSIPLILDGFDVTGHSQTGTGKTAAFGIPVIERISPQLAGKTQVLVLCPTRELAVQACEEMRKFAKYKQGIRVVPVYGGQPIDRQIKALRQAEIVIGTPGRVMDHMRRKTLKLDNLSSIVLDEADEMLNMGFREDIETILKDAPEKRQTILFSATMPPAILNITKQYQTDPKLVQVAHKEMTVPLIKQYYYEVPGGKKVEVLSRLLDVYNPNRSIIFCNTKRMVDELVSELQFRGYMPDGLHGDMKQQARTTVMNAFKRGKTDILIATDVAARGIDVDDVDAVFNFDIPQDVEYYVHRIGRTGRAGKEGTAYTLVCGRRQIQELKVIQRYTKAKIDLQPVPSLNEVEGIKNEKMIEQINQTIEKGGFHKYEPVLDKLIEGEYTSVEVACALLQILSEPINEQDTMIKSEPSFAAERPSKRSKSTVKKLPTKNAGFSKGSMTRMIINVGKRDHIAANHILAAVAGATGLSGKMIGRIEVHDHYSFFEVPKGTVEQVMQSIQGCVINGRKSSTEIVKNAKQKPNR